MDAAQTPQREAADATVTEETALSRSVSAHFAGPVTGQVAIGDGNVLIDRSPGAYVKVTNTPPPRPRPRPAPVRLPPVDFPQLLGRELEVDRASRALMASEPVEFHAPSGWGKTVLIRHLSCHLPAELAADGLVFLDAHGRQQDDLLQILFDVFYATDVPFKPGIGQLRQYLAEVRAVLTFDDLGLDRERLAALAGMVPNSLLLVSSETRTLWGEGEAIQLEGLPEDAALALLERELGRPLAPGERQGAITLCRRVAGQPQAILQAAALMHEQRDSLAQAENGSDISLRLVGSLQPAVRAVLGILASQEGVVLTSDRVARVSRLDGVDGILQSLADKGLVELTPTGWRFSGSLSPTVARLLRTDTWAAALVDEVADWTEAQRGHPAQIASEGALVVHAAEAARRSGAWRQLRRLARAASSALLLSGHWDAWAVLLEEGLEAARQLQDTATEAWCLHQLGTRELCLGNTKVAAALLREALGIRRSLGDRQGTAVTRHNLRLADPGPPWWTDHKVLGGGLALLLAIAAAGFTVGHAIGPWPGSGSGPGPTGSTPVASSSQTPQPTVVRSGPTLGPGSVDFGRITLQGQATRQLSVGNPGDSPITLGPISVGGEFQQASGCPATLAPHGQCTLDVTFHPTAVHRASAKLTLAYGSGGRRTVDLSGEGVAPRLTLDPSALDFKSLQVGRTSAPTTVHLRNPEAVPVGIARIWTDGDFAVQGPCISGPLQLRPGDVCDLAVTFKPSARGTRQGHLQVKGDAVPGPVQLSGFGGMADLRFDPARLDAGSQSVGLPGAVSSVTLTNAGDAPFAAAKVVGTSEFSPTGCQQVLQPSSSCEMKVTFTPQQAGSRSANLQVIDDTGTLGAQLAATGTGLAPIVAFDPPYGIDEHHPADRQSYTASLAVVNQGPGRLMIRSVTLKAAITGSDLLVVDWSACKQPIEPQSSCSIRVTQPSRPLAQGPAALIAVPPPPSFSYLGNLEVSDNASDSPQQVRFEWTG